MVEIIKSTDEPTSCVSSETSIMTPALISSCDETLKYENTRTTGNLQSALLNFQAGNVKSEFEVEGRDRSSTFGSTGLDFSFPGGHSVSFSNRLASQLDEQKPAQVLSIDPIDPGYKEKLSQPKPIKSMQPAHPSLVNSTSHDFSLGSLGSVFIGGLVSHTPPSAVGTSYEARHFGKRMRSGSISSRLQSTTYLEEKGLIDKSQKEILKDLIISGDSSLKVALDKFEEGDCTILEDMIKTGSFQFNRSDIDLLDDLDLDLDFLSVNESTNQLNPRQAFKMKSIVPQHELGNLLRTVPPHLPQSSLLEDDGIGDLDFNGDFGGIDYDMNIDAGERPRSASTATQRLRSGTFGSLDINPPSALDSWVEGAINGTTNIIPTEVDVQGNRSQPADILSRDSMGLPIVINMSTLGDEFIDSNLLNRNTVVDLSNNIAPQIKRNVKVTERKQLYDIEKDKSRKEKKTKPKTKREKKKPNNKSKRVGRMSKTSDDYCHEPKETPSGLGLPRSRSDPNFSTIKDADGLLHVERPDGWVGAYSPESRKIRIERFMDKRNKRVWTKKVKYDVRKNFADSRLRVKGRFVKKEDELLMRDLLSLT